MVIKEEVVKALQQASELLKDKDLVDKLSVQVVKGSEMTWVELASGLVATTVDSIEKGKIVLTGTQKKALATDIILPLLKDKLPFYLKPFASMVIGWFIDILVGGLNKLFTKDWKKEEPKDK